VNGWDVRPTLERIVACSSGRIVRNGLITAPGPDPAPPAAYLRASTERAGHPVAASTAACGGRLGGGPVHDDTLHRPRPCPEPIGDMPPRHILRPTSLHALHCVPSGVVVRAWLPEPCPAATGGSGFTIETGSESAIGIGRMAHTEIKGPLVAIGPRSLFPNSKVGGRR
jgi:hypothetical protein